MQDSNTVPGFPCSLNAAPGAYLEPKPQLYTTVSADPLPLKNNRIYWHLGNFSDDMEPYHQIGILNAAFQNWRNELPFYDFRGTQYLNRSIWRIYFVAPDNYIYIDGKKAFKSPFDFQVSPKTIGCHYGWVKGYKYALHLFVNDNKFIYHTKGDGRIDMEVFCTHEIGHGLELGHTDVEGDIMGVTYDPDATITDDSRAAIVAKHYKNMLEGVKDHNVFKYLSGHQLNEKPKRKGCNLFTRFFRKK